MFINHDLLFWYLILIQFTNAFYPQRYDRSSFHTIGNPFMMSRSSAIFPESEPPYLALVTLGTSCDSDLDLQDSLIALHSAVSTGLVDLVSVRIDKQHNNDGSLSSDVEHNNNNKESRIKTMIQNLLSWSQQYNGFRVVISSDWINVGIQAGVHGVHWKEKHVHQIPTTMMTNNKQVRNGTSLLMGVSTHNVSFAIDMWEKYQPDYMFAGTCFATESHPEKTQLEGPAFPAQVVKAFIEKEEQQRQQPQPQTNRRRPKVLAIGGIDATNCGDLTIPGRYVDNADPSSFVCADGIATIRAVLKAKNPGSEVQQIKQNMKN